MAHPHRRQREIPLHVRIMAAVLAVCLPLVGLDGRRSWQMHGDVIAADLARSLAHYPRDTPHVVDMILSGLRERIEVYGLPPNRPGGWSA